MNDLSNDSQPGKARVPAGTKRIIIFDTNAYRSFAAPGALAASRAKAIRLRECEQANAVFVLASPIVVWELTTHIAELTDRSYNQCLKALVILGEHAVNPANPNGGINLFPDSESTICRELFHLVPTANEQGVRNLGSIVKHVGKHAPDLSDSKAQENIKHIATHVDAFEKEWLRAMQPVLERCDPIAAKQFFGDLPVPELRKKMRDFFASKSFAVMWATFTAQMHASKVGYEFHSKEDLARKCQVLLDVFPVAFHLMSALLQKIALDPNFDIGNPDEKRWNFIWDSQLCFSIGGAHQIAGVPIFFVTSDAEVLAAAKTAKCEDRVLRLTSYLESVGFA